MDKIQFTGRIMAFILFNDNRYNMVQYAHQYLKKLLDIHITVNGNWFRDYSTVNTLHRNI